MKNLKKILAVICVLVLVCVGVVFAAIAEDAYTGTVEELEAKIAVIADDASKADARVYNAVTYLASVDPDAEGYDAAVASLKAAIIATAKKHVDANASESDTEKKIANITSTATLLGYLEIDANTDGYGDVVSGLNASIVEVVDGIADSIEFVQNTETGYWNTMDTKIAINKINSLLKKGVDTLAGAPELEGKLAQINATYNEKYIANKENAEGYATVDEYKYGMALELDFSKGSAPDYGFGKMDNYKTNQYGIEDKDGEKVFTIHYASPSSHTYPQVSTPDASNGIVCEFDFTTFSQMPGGRGFEVSGGGQKNQAGISCDPLIFGITSEGYLYYGDRRSDSSTYVQVTNEDGSPKVVITPGEWVHLAYVFNYSKQTFDIYFEYELVGSSTAKTGSKDSHASADAAPINHDNIRLSASTDSGEFSLDNFKVYRGSAIRTDKKLDGMTKDEEFIYYCDYILDSRKHVLSRNSVYKMAGELIAKYCVLDEDGKAVVEYIEGYGENAAIVAAIEKYLSFDLDEAFAELRRANRDEFIALVDTLESMDRNLTNTAVRMAYLKVVTDFVESSTGNIEQDDLYNVAYTKYQALDKQINCDSNATLFVLSMERFATSPTLVSRQKHLDNASLLKFNETYPLDETYYNSCFKITYDTDGNEISRESLDASFDSFITEYNNYDDATLILEEYIKTDISKKIVTVIDLLKDYDTVEEWQANYDYINEYILILRSYVKDGEDDEDFQEFDTSYEGINQALEIYTTINTWFYNDLQSKHITKLNEQLAAIRATDSYIVKMGVCAAITRYLATEDIDFKNEDIKRIITEHNTYVEELEYRREDYTALLEQNAYYFNTVVTKLSLADDYSEIVSLYEEATVYYFALDANVEGTRDMMLVYDSFTEKLDNIKEYSEKFIESMNLYALVDDSNMDEKFNALVTCYYYSQYAEASYEGVSEKLAAFEVAYDAYMAEVALTNSELADATVIMASSRANNGNAPVVSVILGALEEN